MKSCNKGESWFLGGVLVTCMCGLMLQIMETRVLSVIGYYHLAFFAIGIAMMGMTAGALAVYYRFGHVSPTTLPHLLCRVMTGFAWSVAASLIMLLSLAIQSSFEATLRFVANWGVTILVLLPPYVFLGMAVSLALTRSQYRVSNGLRIGIGLVAKKFDEDRVCSCFWAADQRPQQDFPGDANHGDINAIGGGATHDPGNDHAISC